MNVLSAEFKKNLIFVLLVSFLSGAIGPSRLDAAETASSAIYRFGENLLGAEAASFSGDGEIVGKWREEAFLFKGLGDEAAIRAEMQEIDGVSQQVILFNPIEKMNRRLRFSEVPGGSRLAIQYFTQKDPKLKQITYLYLNVWIGSHLVKKLPIIVSEDGWKQISIDLGVLPFLNSKTTFTFELTGQGVHNLKFSFLANLLS